MTFLSRFCGLDRQLIRLNKKSSYLRKMNIHYLDLLRKEQQQIETHEELMSVVLEFSASIEKITEKIADDSNKN